MGPRRAGKSRIIQKVLEDTPTAYINFEDEQLTNASTEEIIDAMNEVYPNAKFWYLDEIQDYTDWETFLNKLHRRNYNIVVTGSNANLLSSELATALTGRHLAIELLPFSYREYLRATNQNPEWNSFARYLEIGGFPEVVMGSGIDNKTYLSSLYDSILLKDLVRRKNIRNPNYLLNTLSLIINNIASRTSSRAISKALNNTPSAATVEKYISAAAEAYLIETLSSFSHKTKERIQSERKPYAIDSGIVCAKAEQVTPLTSKLLENVIFLTLRRQGHIPSHNLFYYRSYEGYEVDFLVRSGHKTTELIQVCLDVSSMETREREIRSLEQAHKEYPEASLTIITATEIGTIQSRTGKEVQLVPAFEFCSQ